ncbi:MAG: rod shape-determining protein MreD [Oscillospiraceae bacterium]
MLNNLRKVYAAKYSLYVVLFLLFAVLQSTPNFLELFGTRPILLFPCVVAVAMADGELVGGIFGAIGGIFCDYTMSNIFGVNAMLLLVGGTLIGLLVIYYVKDSVKNSLYLCGIVVFTRSLLDLLFGYTIWGYGENFYMFTRGILPSCIYTIAVTPIFYFMFKKLRAFFESKINR